MNCGRNERNQKIVLGLPKPIINPSKNAPRPTAITGMGSPVSISGWFWKLRTMAITPNTARKVAPSHFTTQNATGDVCSWAVNWRQLGENGLAPTGIPYVIVNGTIVVDQGKVLPVKSGQPIRFPVQAKGRFEPVSVNKWIDANSINVPDMHQFDESGAGRIVKKK